jgi:TolA-binding protein
MLTLDKVQLLEDRIRKAVSLINRLREENSSLEDQVQILKTHNEELKDFSKNYSHDNELIEMGISKALAHLGSIEGLSDEIPVEDLNRSAEFTEIDQTGSSISQTVTDGNQFNDDPIISYEDDDPLI